MKPTNRDGYTKTPTNADALIDKVVKSSHRMELIGESI